MMKGILAPPLLFFLIRPSPSVGFSTNLRNQRISHRQHYRWVAKVISSPSSDQDPYDTTRTALSDGNSTSITSEGFGVGEKSIGMRDMIASTDKDSTSSLTTAPSEELILNTTSTAPSESMQPTTTKSAPALRPMSVLKFVAPTLALWIAPPLMSMIDTSVVGRYCGATDLAALSPGCTLIDASAYLFMFIATAATNMVASRQAKAGSDRRETDRIISEALFLACVSGIFLASIVFGAGQPLLAAIAGQQSAAVVPSALKYALIRAVAQPAVVMASVARASALAQKDTAGPLLSVAMAFTLNAIGTIGLVKWTNLGIMGAAIGTLSADVAATCFLLGRIVRSRQTAMEKTPLLVVPSAENFRKFCQYAAPIFFTILGKSVVYNGVAISVGRLGSIALAAHQVLLRNFFFWTPVGDSVGMTSQVFLPGILEEEKRTGKRKGGAKRLLFTVGVLSGLVAAAVAGLLPSQGARLFTNDAAVTSALRRTAPILALSVSMHAIALTCEGMLLAQRDLGFLSNSYVITTVATIALLLSPFRPPSLAGSWWILVLFQGSRALQFGLRTLVLSRRKVLSTR